MSSSAPDEPHRDLLAARDLFHRALSLPLDQREAFVRREARDPAMADQMLAWLRAADQDTAELAAKLRGVVSPTGPSSGTDSASGAPAGERVQSTATGELLKKLATAPKLDTQRFQLEGEIDRGGQGVVLRVHDQFLNRRLAMKVLIERGAPRDEEEKRLVNQLLGRFLEEAQVTSQLDHPGVIPVHELGLDQSGKVYFTMRMVKGSTASERFEDAFHGRGEWNLTRGLEVILRVCDTMAYAHDKGVLHRDLKPGNVMVGRFGEVYVMDWGLAKVLGQQDRHDLRIRKDGGTGVSTLETARKRDAEAEAENSVVSMDGQQLGTPSYMSPEQARSEELDARADVYSIGAMMYELATGSPPYVPRGIRKRAYLILEDVVLRPPERVEVLNKNVPAELVAVIEKAMARDREQRYRTVLELAADVRAFMAHRVVSAYRTGAWQETKLWVRRNKPLAASLAAAVLLLVGVVAIAVSFGTAEAKAKGEAIEQQRIAEQNAETARQNSTLARTAQQEADGKAKALAAKVAEFDQLALVVDYDKLIKEEEELCTAYPEQAEAIAGWLQRAQRLLGRKDELAAVVAAVQQSVGSETANATAQFLAQSLGDLLGKLPKLAELVPAMQQRQRWAQAIGPLTLAHPNAKVTWAEARAAIAASPKYAGQEILLRDRDVWGLVPLGENQQSKLWEFYDLRSAWDGTTDIAHIPIPEHQPDGRILVTGSTGIVWILIPGGALPYGISATDAGAKWRNTLELDPLLLAKYEVTQGQWLRWTGANPASSTSRNDLSLPVELVNWFSCHDTLKRFGLALPSELQWEHAFRGGTTTMWWTGDDENVLMQAENFLSDQTMPVGSKAPNQFGLFDMGGNVREWCHEENGPYGSERAGDGRRPNPPNGPHPRSNRGGCFIQDPSSALAVTRHVVDATYQFPYLGLRAARTLSPENLRSRISYATQLGDSVDRHVTVGRSVALALASPTMDHSTMQKALAALDAAYAFYSEANGREPGSMGAITWKGRTLIAEVDQPRSIGIGLRGLRGVEIQPLYISEFLNDINKTGRYDHTPFYLLSYNFWFYGPQLEYQESDAKPGSVSTGYAVLMRFLGMDAACVDGSNFHGRPFSEFRAEVEKLVDTYEMDSYWTWNNTLREARGVPNPMNLGATDLFASFCLRLMRNLGGSPYIGRLWREAGLCPAATTTQDAVDNFVVASSLASKRDLSPIFLEQWRWPVSPSGRERAKKAGPALDRL